MAETPQSAYDVYSAVCTATLANVPTVGYCVTTASDGVEVATTTLLGTSSTGTIDGIALTTGTISQVLQVQREGRIDKSLLTWLSTGSVEVLVADSNGKPQRASAASGVAIGMVDKAGNAYLDLDMQSALFYQTVQANGTSRTQRRKLNFSDDFTATDDGANDRTTIATVGGCVVYDTYANRPAAAKAGRVFVTSDGSIVQVDTGSVWKTCSSVERSGTQPLAASNYTVTQTSNNASLTDDKGCLLFTAAKRVTTEDSALATLATPGQTSVFSNRGYMLHVPGGQNGSFGFFDFSESGLCAYETSSTKVFALFLYTGSTGATRVQVRYKTGLTATAGTAPLDVDAAFISRWPAFLAIDHDGTNMLARYSQDGRNWITLASVARTTVFTTGPDKAGLYINPFNADAKLVVLGHELVNSLT